jgi:hypothetical protein
MERLEIVMYLEQFQLWPYWHASVFSVTNGERRWHGSAGSSLDPGSVYLEAQRLIDRIVAPCEDEPAAQ